MTSTVPTSLNRPHRRMAFWLMLAVIAITFFVNNRVIRPDIMESRNLVTAREMVEKGNILVPTMNDELRLEKPPLPTWLSAVVEALTPGNIAAQRALAGMAAILLIVFFYLLCRDILKVDPVVATILLCTCYNFMLMARTISWDIFCHAFMTGGIYFFARAMLGNGRCIKLFAWAGLLTGLSILSKGPVSLFALFLPFIIAFSFAFRPSARGKWGGITILTLIALTVGLWWYAYIHIFHADSLNDMINRESGAWMGRNVRPWHYYKLFFLEAGIWAVMLLTAVATASFQFRRLRNRRIWLPLVWLLASLVLLSVIPEKKTRYLFPILIPAAILMAQTVDYWKTAFAAATRSRIDVAAFRINALLLSVVAFGLPVAAWFMLVKPDYMGWPMFVLFIAVAFSCGCLLFRAATRLNAVRMVTATGILFAAAVVLAFPAAGNLINNPRMTGLDLTVADQRLHDIPFYHNADDELRIELVYDARRDIRPIDVNADPDSLSALLPMAFLSHTGADELPAALLQQADTLHIGIFDCNRRPKGTRRYSSDFIYHLTLITPRNTSTDEQD